MGLTYTIGYNLTKLVAKTCFGFRVIGRERILEEGGCILAMNHESYIDPPLAGVACKRELFYLARKTLLKLKRMRSRRESCTGRRQRLASSVPRKLRDNSPKRRRLLR